MHMENMFVINNYLMIGCILLFPMDAYAQSETTTEINIYNQFSNKEKAALKRIVFQSTAFLLRSVGLSAYPSDIINDLNNRFIIEQNIKFYENESFENAPEAIKIYFRECFAINSFILKNSISHEDLIKINEKRKLLKNNLNKSLAQYNIEYDRILFEMTGKTGNDLMYPFVKKAFHKYDTNKINMNNQNIMEKVIKDAYVDLADFLYNESVK